MKLQADLKLQSDLFVYMEVNGSVIFVPGSRVLVSYFIFVLPVYERHSQLLSEGELR